MQSPTLTICLSLILVNTRANQVIYNEWEPEVIDINLYNNGNEFERNLIVDKFDKALQKTGIIRLINHGIHHRDIQNSYNTALEFFEETSVAEKSKYRMVNGTKCGYKGPKDFFIDKIRGPLDKELDNFAHRDVGSKYDNVEVYWFNLDRDESFNVYPRQSDPGIKNSFINNKLWTASKEYISGVSQLWQTINKLASLSLKCDMNIFNDKIKDINEFYSMFIYFYYPQSETKINLGAHTDWMTFTFVQNDDVEGLQLNLNNTWYDVKNYNDDSLLLFIGDAIKIMTNDYWESTWHRVLMNKEHKQRLTMSYFAGSDYNSVMKPEYIHCKNIKKKSKYTPQKVSDYYAQKYASLSDVN